MKNLLSLALATLVACSAGSDRPEEPVWGKQPCAHCAMLVSDKASAAQAVDAHGERHFFDDAGCLVAWEAKLTAAAPKHWVRLADGEGWVAPEQARFRRGAHTPMDFGFQAVGGGGDADWSEVVSSVKNKVARP